MQTHEQRLQELLEKDKTHPKDMERKAMFYVLSGNDDLYSKVHHIYDFQENSINSECLDSNKVDFSSSARKLIKLAYNLYNGFPADVSDTFYLLDEENSKLAIEAIKLRFNF
jgi:hypothetical protein